MTTEQTRVARERMAKLEQARALLLQAIQAIDDQIEKECDDSRPLAG